MRDMQLIYASRPFGYDDLTLTSILMQARKNNARNGITGALICREALSHSEPRNWSTARARQSKK